MSPMGVAAWVLLAAGAGCALAGAWRLVGWARGGVTCCCRTRATLPGARWLAAGVALAGVGAVSAGWAA